MASQRPLSPHLQIYKIQLTSLLSITHRLTGIFLTSALIGLIFWLMALASSAQCFQVVMNFYQSWLGKIVLLLWWCCFFYHLSNGIRHLIWDAGYGLDLKEVYRGGWFVVALTLLMGLLGIIVILK